MALINVQGYRPHNALSALVITIPTPQSCVQYPTYYYRCVINRNLIRLSLHPQYPILLFTLLYFAILFRYVKTSHSKGGMTSLSVRGKPIAAECSPVKSFITTDYFKAAA